MIKTTQSASDSEPIGASDRAVLVDLSSTFLAEYTFYFSVVYFDEAIRLRYLISPDISTKNGRDRFRIYAEVQDNIGSEYLFMGGAYGLWKFAPCTDGVLTFSPLPPEGAEILSFTIKAWQRDETGEFRFSLLLEP